MTTIHQAVTKVSYYIPDGFAALTLVQFTLCFVTEEGWLGCKMGFRHKLTAILPQLFHFLAIVSFF